MFTVPRPRRYALLESLRTVTPFASPKTTIDSKFRNHPSQPPPGVVVNSKPPFEPRPVRPDIDRSVNLQADTGDLVNLAEVFALLLAQNDLETVAHPLFTLPPVVRRKIYGYCFPVEDRKISLSPRFATKAAWAMGYFASPWEVLEDVMGGIASFRALRHDIMTYFWVEYQFHVTLTPFSGPIFSPLSHVWMQDYLGVVQRLTVEADLTRFGGSQLVNAPQFGYDVERIEILLIAIVDGILERQHGIPMAEFNLMCRRYTGFRPPPPPPKKTALKTSEDISKASAGTPKTLKGTPKFSKGTPKFFKSTPKLPKGNLTTPEEISMAFEPIVRRPKYVPYSPEECMLLCDVVCNLWGVVQSSQVSGFTLQYTQLLLTAMIGQGKQKSDIKTPKSSPWPIFPLGSVIIPTPKVVSEFEFGLRSSKNQVTAGNIDNKMQETMETKDKMLINEQQNSTTEVTARPSTPEQKHLISTLREDSGPTCLPMSPNTMNKLNEQDPAFRRTLDALRSADSQNRVSTNLPTLQSVLFSYPHEPASVPGDRHHSKMKDPKTEVPDKKYPSFMGRFKGMFSK